ncbi:MAG: hypothetical protein IT436_13645 [Phycisphaerales bacterium]|nr:hypothetical protein [Phycisphaerales bacterium]
MTSHTDNLIDAARRLLAAREDLMLTADEWDDLARAVAACGRGSVKGDHGPGPAPSGGPITASGMATFIRQVLDLALEAATDPDDGLFELAEPLAGYEVLTYEDAGIPTHDAGLVIRAPHPRPHGREFQVTVVRSR